MSPFWTPKHDIWGPLWHRFFIVFVEWPKIKKSVCFSILFDGFGPSKPLIFRSFFHRFFMFFQNRSPGLFLDGPSAELLWKVGFWCHLRFSWFSKRHFLDDLFAQVDEKKRNTPSDPRGPSRDPAFHEIIIIVVPFGPIVFLLKSFVRKRLAHLLFFYVFLCAMI